jgi:hypothetical protein
MGKLTISIAIFNSKLLNYQRVMAVEGDFSWDVHGNFELLVMPLILGNL